MRKGCPRGLGREAERLEGWEQSPPPPEATAVGSPAVSSGLVLFIFSPVFLLSLSSEHLTERRLEPCSVSTGERLPPAPGRGGPCGARPGAPAASSETPCPFLMETSERRVSKPLPVAGLCADGPSCRAARHGRVTVWAPRARPPAGSSGQGCGPGPDLSVRR